MEIFIVFALLVTTFITRVFNLTGIPVFTDEAIYIRWAQIGLSDPAHRYISLSDGKQPLFTWLMYPFLPIFNDPLFAARMVSVVAGVLSCFGLYLVGRELFKKKAAFFTAILYITSPFFIVYDKLALMDSLLATFGIWGLYLEILLIRKTQLDIALLLGINIGLGLITKSSALFYIILLPASLILFDFKAKKRIKILVRWALLSLISIFISQVMNNSLRLSPLFYIIEQKNNSFVETFPEFFKSPFSLLIPNLNGLLEYLIVYLTWPIILLTVVSVVIGFIRKDRRIILLFIWFVFPFISLASFGKVIFPRFILFMTPALLVISGYSLSVFYRFAIDKIRYFLVMPLVFMLLPIIYSSLVIFSPIDSVMPEVDRNQLFDKWPSGYGVNRIIRYLEDKLKEGNVFLATEGTFGMNPAVYEIYLGKYKNFQTKGYWPLDNLPEELKIKSMEMPTYLVLKESEKVNDTWKVEEIFKIRRGKGDSNLLFYKIVPE